MKLSVIIATFNRRDLLAQTLPRLLKQNYPSDQYEILMVVDGSTDGSAQFLKSIAHPGNLRVIEQPNRGQAAAINEGLRQSTGEIVLFLDDDILCEPNLVAEHANAERTERACLAFGPVLVSPGGRDLLATRWAQTFCDDFFATKVHEAPETGWYGCMASANSSMPRCVALSIGGLNDTFTRGNDVEFGFRLLRDGYSFHYLPNALTHQVFTKTRTDIIDDAEGEGRAEIRLGRLFPALRSTSRFALLSVKPWWKRLIARAIATAPLSFLPLLSLFTALFHTIGLGSLALRLLLVQQNIAAYRSAVREAGSWSALQREYGARLPILMYHNIGPLREGFDEFLNIHTEMFEQHLRWLSRNHYTPIHLSEWIAWMREGTPLPPKPVLLTFDDAYRDTANFGFPLLKKFGFKGTLFVVTNHIGGTNKWDLHLNVSEQPLMSAEEIRTWSVRGIEIGSHSLSHPDLRTCSDDEIQFEMDESRQSLEKVACKPVLCFAYPYGYFDHRAPAIARSTYDAALTCDLGINCLATDPMRLKRIIVIPRYTLGQMFWATKYGFNPWLTLRIQAGIRLKPLILRVFPFLRRNNTTPR
ncbi:MAG: glycosyltransferase [Acidobacteria bacterium]|nr:glycosyltransferase [Acidobacteriota bacterium]